MKWWKRESRLMIILVAVLTILLLLLATLQYRWLGQLSDADREQMRGILRAAAVRFGQDFDRELDLVYLSFQPDRIPSAENDDRSYATKYSRWASATQFPHLIKSVWLASAEENSSISLKELDLGSHQFTPVRWPAEMDWLRKALEGEPRNLQTPAGLPAPNVPGQQAEPPQQVMRSFSQSPLVLIIPVFRPPSGGKGWAVRRGVPPGAIIATLDLKCIREEILPALTRRHFAEETGLNCQITIIARDAPGTPIFRSGASPVLAEADAEQAAAAAVAGADLTVGMFRLRFRGFPSRLENLQPGENNAFRKGPSAMDGAPISPRFFRDPSPWGSAPGMDGPRGMNAGDWLWAILVQHRAGSLAAAVAIARHRNLTLSFGILLLLAGSVVMLVISTRRARRLARQQFEFVAGVTHELRTPVAVICSAAENLADGVIKDHSAIRHYGVLIRDEGRRLAGMVEQVLDFAGAQSGRNINGFKPISAANLIDKAVGAVLPSLKAGRFQLDKEIQQDLPQVKGNESALCHALQNLLNNSIKYSGSSRWIGLRAEACAGKDGKEVRITVEDRGIGIPAKELPRIFEPFFRGEAVAAAQIHGNGLGLAVVRSIVDAHGGRITVDSSPGRGSEFSIFLPALFPESELAAERGSV